MNSITQCYMLDNDVLMPECDPTTDTRLPPRYASDLSVGRSWGWLARLLQA